MHASDTLTFCT